MRGLVRLQLRQPTIERKRFLKTALQTQRQRENNDGLYIPIIRRKQGTGLGLGIFPSAFLEGLRGSLD